MVASSSNLMLLASTHEGNHDMHVRNNSTIPNDHDHDLLQMDPTMNRSFMIRSNSNNNIRGSTGNLKDMIMLETVLMAPTPTATYPNKNGGGFSMASSNSSSSKKKNRCMSGGNLKNLLYVLEPLTTPSLPVITSASASASASTDDDWFLGDEEEEDIISDDEEEEEDSITPITIENTTRPADTIIATPSTPGRKPSPSLSPSLIPPKKEEKKSASIRMETIKMKDTTIRFPIIENRASFGASSSSSSSSSSTMGSTNLKDIMLETAALSSASVSSFRSSRSTSTSAPAPVPAPVQPAPTLTATWSTNTSMEALTSLHCFFSIPLSAPKMPDLFSCGTTGTTATSFDPQKVKKDFTKKMSSCTTRSTPIQKKKNHHTQNAVNVDVGKRLHEVKNDLFFQLNLPASSQKEEEEECSGRTAVTASSTCMSSPEEQEQEQQEEEESFFGRETTKLSPRIMMFYQDDDDDDDIMMMMAPLSASRLSFYHQEQEEEEVTPDVNHNNTPTPASNLSLLTNIALSLASPVSNDTKDHDHDNDDDDDDEYGIFFSFSDDEKEDPTYTHEYVSSPSLQYNDYAFHNSKTTTPFFGVTTRTAVAGRNSRQQRTE